MVYFFATQLYFNKLKICAKRQHSEPVLHSAPVIFIHTTVDARIQLGVFLFIYFFIRQVNNANEPNTHNFMV